ncbi:MAG: HD family phosphohydrolase [Candidatus Muiribacteriota bacterium]
MKIKQFFSRFFVNINMSLIRKIIGLIICLFLSVFIISYDFLKVDHLKEGEVSPVDITASRDVKYFDYEATRRIEQSARNHVQTVYEINKSVSTEIRNNIENFFQSIKENNISEEIPQNLKEKAAKFKLLKEDKKEEIKSLINNITEQIIKEGVRSGEVSSVLNIFSQELDLSSRFSSEEVSIIKEILSFFVKPNKFPDEAKTKQLKEIASRNIQPVERFVKKGELILRQGEIIDKEALSILNNIGYFDKSGIFLQRAFGFFLLFLFFIIVLFLYLSYFNPDILNEEPLVYFIQVIIFLCVASFKFFDIILKSEIAVIMGDTALPLFSEYLFPVAAIAMLVTIVIDSKFSILLTSMLSVVGGLIFQDVNFVVVAVIGSVVAIYSIMFAKTRAEQMLSGLYLIITNICLIIALHFIDLNYFDMQQHIKFLLRDVSLGFINGTFSVIFAMGTMPIFEKIFKVTSAIRLLELTDLNNKILKNLLEQAPGTYHHSVMVANLAEAAATEIGADTLLTRIGGYYHDIGKLRRPFFFSENLMGRDNQHEDLNPNLSAIIIISHVKDGLEIAKQYNLPEEIIHIISQHHGTTLVKYFYEKARKDLGDNIKDSKFRYPGPKPQTKESALVMLADSIESATRSLSAPSPSSIENLIKKITNDKFIDEQFDECNLTLKEIEKIRNVFSKVLLQMFHKRIEYPDTEEKGQGVFR